MSTSRSVAQNTVVQFAARIVGAAAQALIVIILARTFVHHLGPEEGVREMGRYTTIFAFTVLFGTFSEFGLFPTLVKEFAEKPHQSRSILAKALPLRLLVAMIVALLGIVLALLLHFESVITIGIVLLAISTLWTAIANTIVAYFQSRLLMRYPAIAEIAGRLGGFVVVASAALLHASLLTIVVLSLLGFLVTFMVNIIILSRFERLGWDIDIAYWRTLLGTALPVGLISVLALIYFKIDSVMLAAMRGTYDVGVYGIPYKLIDVLITLPTLFVSNVFPVLAQALHHPERAQHIFRKAFDFLAISGLPITTAVFAFAIPIIHLIGGQTYLSASSVVVSGVAINAVTVLRILILAVLFAFFGNLLSCVIILKKLQGRYVWAAVLAMVFNIGINFVVIPRYSYFGTSISTVLTEIVVAVPGWYLVWRATPFRPNWSVFTRALAAALTMGAVLWPLQQLPFGLALAIGLPLGIGVYVAGLQLLGVSVWHTARELLTKSSGTIAAEEV